MNRLLLCGCLWSVSSAVFLSSIAADPGPRPVSIEGPQMIPGLTGGERELFRKGLEAFQRVHSVQGDAFVPNTEVGLGPGFNLDSCAGCHAHPAIGGTSPRVNPQIEAAAREGARNRIPLFIRPDGPALQVRRKPGGMVAALFTITGRRDAASCDFPRPDFDAEYRRGSLAFRIPTPVFGAGLIEAIDDATILANLAANAQRKRSLGIAGRVNRDPRDGSITRFGWKAQTRSLDQFAGEAYLLEQGVTNELFPQEVGNPPEGCRLNATPEDRKTVFGRLPSEAHSNVTRQAHFMRFLAPLPPGQETEETRKGKAVFERIGCGLCHTPELKSGRAANGALGEKPVSLYSDLALHRMGAGVADGVRQGEAEGDEFRTAPLWGLGYRIFLMHDGRARSLEEAILAHGGSGRGASVRGGRGREGVSAVDGG